MLPHSLAQTSFFHLSFLISESPVFHFSTRLTCSISRPPHPLCYLPTLTIYPSYSIHHALSFHPFFLSSPIFDLPPVSLILHFSFSHLPLVFSLAFSLILCHTVFIPPPPPPPPTPVSLLPPLLTCNLL